MPDAAGAGLQAPGSVFYLKTKYIIAAQQRKPKAMAAADVFCASHPASPLFTASRKPRIYARRTAASRQADGSSKMFNSFMLIFLSRVLLMPL